VAGKKGGKRGNRDAWAEVLAQMSVSRSGGEVVELLREFKFMRTDQIHRAVFSGTSLENCRKVLRRLERMGVVGHVRPRRFRRKGEREGHWAYWHLSSRYCREVLGKPVEISEAAHIDHWRQLVDVFLCLREIPRVVVEEYRVQVEVQGGLVADGVFRLSLPDGKGWLVYVEVDRGTESLAVVDRKLVSYSGILGWGSESGGLGNRCLLVVVKSAERAESIAGLLRRRHKRVPGSVAFGVLRNGDLVRLVVPDQAPWEPEPLALLKAELLGQPPGRGRCGR
jgi:hypothetical protein